MQTLQQQRAKSALEAVKKLTLELEKENKPEDLKKLKALKARASELPFMIHTAGLGQAAAFFKSKQKDGYPELFNILQAWLCQAGRPYDSKTPDLLHSITTKDMTTYRVAQAEAMAYMDWVKTFAAAYWTDGKTS